MSLKWLRILFWINVVFFAGFAITGETHNMIVNGLAALFIGGVMHAKVS